MLGYIIENASSELIQDYDISNALHMMGSHDSAAAPPKFPENFWKILLDSLLNLIVLLIELLLRALLLLLPRVATLLILWTTGIRLLVSLWLFIWLRRLILLLAVVLLAMLLRMMFLIGVIVRDQMLWHLRRSSLKINVYSPRIVLGSILKA